MDTKQQRWEIRRAALQSLGRDKVHIRYHPYHLALHRSAPGERAGQVGEVVLLRGAPVRPGARQVRAGGPLSEWPTGMVSQN
jgi:hypothetical protein